MQVGDVIKVHIVDRLPGNRYLGDHNGKAVIITGACNIGEDTDVTVDSIGKRLIYARK